MSAGSKEEVLRAARNQTLYREVNERIEDLNERFDMALEAAGMWVCECADPKCSEQLEMTLGEYERLRGHPNHFAVARGHVYEAVERIVEEYENYVIVAKFGPGATYAVENDPRQGERA